MLYSLSAKLKDRPSAKQVLKRIRLARMNNIYTAIESRKKFIAALVGIAIAIFGERAGISADALTLAIVTIVGYITASAIEDGLRWHARAKI